MHFFEPIFGFSVFLHFRIIFHCLLCLGLKKYIFLVFVTKITTTEAGAASSEGERQPTNPAIWVQFSTEADEFFFCAVAENV